MHVAVGKCVILSVVGFDGEHCGEYRRNFAFDKSGFASSDVDFHKHGYAHEFLHSFFCACD